MGSGNGQVEIELDQTRVLRFDFAALCRLEDLGLDLARFKEVLSSPSVSMIARFLCAGLAAHEDLTLKETIRIIDAMPGSVGEKLSLIGGRISDAISLSMPEGGEDAGGNVKSSEGKVSGDGSAVSGSAS